jgi:hypothetical protein
LSEDAAMRTKLAAVLISVTAIGHAVGYLVATREHIVDIGWPRHARFHVTQGLFWLLTLDGASVWLAMGPFRRGEGWARWALVAAWVSAHWGYFATLVAMPEGRPATANASTMLAVVLGLFGIGLAMGWKPRD